MMKKKKAGRVLLSFLLSLAMVIGFMPGMGMTAHAEPTEELLTTITATGQEQASYSTENVASVSFSYTTNGSSSYYNNGTTNWGWWGYGWIATVTPADGYTITKCVFYDDKDRTATDSEAPFVVETTEADKEPQVNGTPILANQSKGITKIEVYGYANPTTVDVTGVSLNKTTTTLTVGDTETLTATVSPDDATDKSVTWSSDNTGVATVDPNGLVTAVGAGTATITVTSNADNTKTASCIVTVPAVTSSVTLITNGGTINSGDVTSYTEGTGATLPTDVTKDGYIFVGWYDTETNTVVTAIDEDATGDKTYEARWIESLVGKVYPVDGTGQLVVESLTRFSDGQGGNAFAIAGTYAITIENTTENPCLYRLNGTKVYIANDTSKKIIGLTITSGTGLPGNPYVFGFIYANPVSYTATFKVVNGYWDDGTTADKIVTLTGYEGDTLKLTSDQIPTVGTNPNANYKAGSWDVTPDTNTAITGNVTYTYTYASDSSSGDNAGGSSGGGSGDNSGGTSDSGSGDNSGGSSGGGSGDNSGGSTGGGTSDSTGDNTGGTSGDNTGDSTNNKVPYEDVAISSGSVNDITGIAAATAETNPFNTKIENSSNLTTLLSLTDTEVAQGVNVWLDIQDMSSTVSQTDKNKIENASGDYKVGLYLDINLFKKVGANDATKVTETNGKIKASILIPESLWKSGRTFEIIRVHNGETTVISGTYNESTHIFTFETDKFSTYAVAYKDASSSDNNSSSDSGSSSDNGNSTESTAPKTGDPNDIRLWYLLLFASLSGLGFLGFTKKKNAEE